MLAGPPTIMPQREAPSVHPFFMRILRVSPIAADMLTRTPTARKSTGQPIAFAASLASCATVGCSTETGNSTGFGKSFKSSITLSLLSLLSLPVGRWPLA